MIIAKVEHTINTRIHTATCEYLGITYGQHTGNICSRYRSRN